MEDFVSTRNMLQGAASDVEIDDAVNADLPWNPFVKTEGPSTQPALLSTTNTFSIQDLPAHRERGGAMFEPVEITKEQFEENIRLILAAEQKRQRISDETVDAQGIKPDSTTLQKSLGGHANPEGPFQGLLTKQKAGRLRVATDFFAGLRNYPELLLEIAEQLRVKDFVSLYAISKDFHCVVKSYLCYTMRNHAKYNAPESSKVFLFTFYDELCTSDPAGLPHPTKAGQIRRVPGLRWLQMVVHREKTIRDILACMARSGHRMPQGMSLTVKKMWLLMDIATSARRVQLMHSDFFTDMDLYNIQMFVVKLDMRFNDPVEGPGDEGLRELMLGQRGLTPLCKLLKRTAFKDPMEAMKLSIRYEFNIWPEHLGMPMFDIPPHEIGVGHLEGWGSGRVHLMRPDELVVHESVRRQLNLKEHFMMMMLWGYVDPYTCKDIETTADEMYMSDDD